MKNEPRIIDSMRIRYIYMATAVAFFEGSVNLAL